MSETQPSPTVRNLAGSVSESTDPEPSGHASGESRQTVDMTGIGLVTYAGAVLILAGFFEVIEGLTGVLRPAVYVAGGDHMLIALGYSGWGWLHLALGVLSVVTGVAVFALRPWACTVGIVLAGLSAIVNLAFIPAYPIWGVVLIGVDLLVIYALVAHGARHEVQVKNHSQDS
ncbi:hypothetical protein LQ327_00680 [Actinomycetospora endophytica]|uniref:DUF7144 domain-containing protein n=1 Tax=Actinomycetospora endophytica TaxID=2291215 RepID=A0ABS8P4B7_9PSEU|nr:hypothetical protein [Actinomycetospora endophytica]MCD2191904.1 hypothetical protein [Actinomycetospora endophytica]